VQVAINVDPRQVEVRIESARGERGRSLLPRVLFEEVLQVGVTVRFK